MITIDANQYSALTRGARVLERHPRHGPSVFCTDDGRIIKAFHRSRRFASRRWSYANRFTRHAGQLARRGFQSVTVEAVYRCLEQGADLVVYPMLPGRSLRELAGDRARRALSILPQFLADLHRGGVHFRGIHFGNLLIDDDDRFALIDISYMRFYPWPLDLHGRASNFRNILRYREDAAMLAEFGFGRFMERYFAAAGLSRRRCSRLARLIGRGSAPDSIAAELDCIANIRTRA